MIMGGDEGTWSQGESSEWSTEGSGGVIMDSEWVDGGDDRQFGFGVVNVNAQSVGYGPAGGTYFELSLKYEDSGNEFSIDASSE